MDTTVHAGRIVVGADHSDSAREATEWAAGVAAFRRVPLHLVHVPTGDPDGTGTAAAPAWLTELAAAAERIGARPCLVDIAGGSAVDVLAARAEGAGMLVLGSYGAGGRSGMLAGSVALGLLDRVSCPLAVVRGRVPAVSPPRDGPVVVGVDGSPSGRVALDVAAELARGFGARLVALLTWSEVVAGPGGSPRRLSGDGPALAGAASALLDSEIGRIALAYPDLRVERDVVGDTAMRALLDRAVTARLVVVGHRGQLPGSGMGLGSTSRALVEFAQCPVVVAGPGTALDEDDAGVGRSVTRAYSEGAGPGPCQAPASGSGRGSPP